jgi:ABC-2 type transport system permease protein
VTAPTRLSTLDIPNGPTASPRVPSLAIRAADLLASEWTKFRSVRSTYWTLLVALLTPIAFSALVAFAFANAPAKAGPPPDPLLPEVLSLEYAVIAVSVLGVLSFSAEYSTGLIRTTFAAAPRRRAVLAAKATVLAAVTLAAGELVAFASFFLSQAVLAGHHQGVSLSRPGVPGAVLSAGVLDALAAAALGPAEDLAGRDEDPAVLAGRPAQPGLS